MTCDFDLSRILGINGVYSWSSSRNNFNDIILLIPFKQE